MAGVKSLTLAIGTVLQKKPVFVSFYENDNSEFLLRLS
jgi:hypothetical protein